MVQQGKDLKDMTLLEKESLAFRIIEQIETSKQNLQVIQQSIAVDRNKLLEPEKKA